MISRISLLFVFLLSVCALSAQTSLEGKVTDGANGEPILFGTVALFKNGVLVTGTETDFDGNYLISNIDPGNYDVEFSYVGYQTQRITGMVVKAGQSNKLDQQISEGVLLQTAIVVGYKAPLIDFDNTTQGNTITSEEIRSLPTKNINAIAATSAGLSSVDGGDISIRGSRSNATDYYIDGVRVRSTNGVPQSEIDQLQVITGGLDAQYGDVTGGIISITTKGPSQKYTGGVEFETSEFLDNYGYNLVSGNVSGPILKNSEDKSILGFRFSGQYRTRFDPSPSAVGVHRASDEIIDRLELNPTIPNFGEIVPNAETLSAEEIGAPLAARPNTADESIDLTGKIDARLSDNIDVTLSGSYSDSQDRFAPSTAWTMFNWRNNPFLYEDSYRANFRFRHKLGRQNFGEEKTDEEKAAAASLIQNATYTIQVGYEKFQDLREDFRHEDRFFDYGYYGRTDRVWMPAISEVSDTLLDDHPAGFGLAHQGYLEEVGEFAVNESANVNPVLARYNQINGIPEATLASIWNIYSNVGQVYNRYEKNESDRYTLNVSSNFDFLPGGSQSGRHNIQFGFTYEQRVNRRWVLAPRALWEIASQNVNRHITGVDRNTVIDSIPSEYFQFNEDTGMLDTIQFSYPVYAPLSQADEFSGLSFFKEVRKINGEALNEYVNIDGLNPSDLTLDMFSARELNDRGALNYYGFDYLGNKTNNDVAFNDFFTSRDENGIQNFLVAPLQPIYGAGYIQDKFTYKDIIFRVGVRVDYFDANTKVLKDPYSLYEIENVNDFYARTGQNRIDGLGDDYKVYVAGEGSDIVTGYRQGDEWFAPNGTRVSGGNILFGGGIVHPSYVNRDEQTRNIQDANYNPDDSFEDYDPQLNFMPRLAFSFPISEDAGFFAHYDVLVQRPPSNVEQTALDYYYLESNPPDVSNNSNLLPETTIDYELGFQQKLSNSTALKVSAYYKELRNMIQRRFFFNVPPPINSYETFGNIDFGTVKGFSFAYDMRRTGNLQLNATYTLQFADGSGSDANSSGGLNQFGDLRNLFPLSFDERHRFNISLDYRYDKKGYNGPVLFEKDIFADAGINIQTIAVSGRPYTATLVPDQFGGSGTVGDLNGARLPWNFTVNVRVDKNFTLFEPANRPAVGLNVYLRVQNLLDRRNLLGVYSATGSAYDDGYLNSVNGQSLLEDIERQGLSEFYIPSYNWRLLNPGFFTLPRRIYLGAILQF